MQFPSLFLLFPGHREPYKIDAKSQEIQAYLEIGDELQIRLVLQTWKISGGLSSLLWVCKDCP